MKSYLFFILLLANAPIVQGQKILIAFSVDKAKEKKSKANEYFEKAEEQFEKELYDEAINNYTKAIANDAKNSNYYNSRGVTYYTKKEYYKAIGDFMKAIEVKPDYVRKIPCPRQYQYFITKLFGKFL
jgi:tetratricopeptide (TPR) repeat protein